MLYSTQNPHGGDVYADKIQLDFSANTNPFGTPKAVLRAIEDSLQSIHQYPDPYCRELVGAISQFEEVPEDAVLCGNGAAELIYSYISAVQPKKAAVLAPTFSEYGLGLSRTGCPVVQFTLKQENGFALTEAFRDFLQETKPQAVFLCNPNNPTGKTADFSLLQSVLELCHREHIRLFADECFLDLTDGAPGMKEFLQDYPELFILKAFTKSYGMAGIRLGYGLSCDRELLKKMSRQVQPWNVSTPAQAAGVAALQQQDFLNKTRDLIREERKWLRTELRKLDFWVCDSQTNFLLFRGPEGLCPKLKKLGIAIRNCDNYQGLGPGWYRIAVRLHSENEILIDAIRQETERR